MRPNLNSRFATEADILRNRLQTLLNENHLTLAPVHGVTPGDEIWYRLTSIDLHRSWNYGFQLRMQETADEAERLQMIIFAVEKAIARLEETYGHDKVSRIGPF